ncbi:MAG TPA: M23 family metallopeptidase [Myxococcaceae bacterium]
MDEPLPPPAPLEAMPLDGASWWPPELTPALRAFIRRAHANRAQRTRADPVPPAEVDNWREFLAHLDGYLARAGAAASDARDGIVRQALEAELERDARAYGELPPELVEDLLERLDQLSTPAARTATSRFLWPVDPVEVTSPFGWRVDPLTHEPQQHQGIDLAAEPAQPVRSAGDGVVVRARFGNGHGNSVEMDHGGGVTTRYSHLFILQVAPGASVKRGDVIGLAGSTGRATGAHLHFEVWRDGDAVDPLEALGPPGRGADADRDRYALDPWPGTT